MRRTRTTPILIAAFVAALVTPGGLLASEGPISGLGGELAGALDVRGGDAAGSAVEKLNGDAGQQAKPVVREVERLAQKADRGDRRSGADRRPVAERETRASGTVEIRDFLYSPETITIDVGDSVTWTNADSAPHDAKAFDGSFQTSVIDKGGSDSVSFDQEGTFRYFCSLHPPEQFPEFTGEVVVGDGGSSSGSSGDGTGDGGDSGPNGGGSGSDTSVSSDDGGTSSGSASGGSAAGQESGKGGGSDLASTGRDLSALMITGLILLAAGFLSRRAIRSA